MAMIGTIIDSRTDHSARHGASGLAALAGFVAGAARAVRRALGEFRKGPGIPAEAKERLIADVGLLRGDYYLVQAERSAHTGGTPTKENGATVDREAA